MQTTGNAARGDLMAEILAIRARGYAARRAPPVEEAEGAEAAVGAARARARAAASAAARGRA